MNKEQFINLINTTLSNKIIQKYIKGEINLTKTKEKLANTYMK